MELPSKLSGSHQVSYNCWLKFNPMVTTTSRLPQLCWSSPGLKLPRMAMVPWNFGVATDITRTTLLYLYFSSVFLQCQDMFWATKRNGFGHLTGASNGGHPTEVQFLLPLSAMESCLLVMTSVRVFLESLPGGWIKLQHVFVSSCFIMFHLFSLGS